jgi:hypothetical protein
VIVVNIRLPSAIRLCRCVVCCFVVQLDAYYVAPLFLYSIRKVLGPSVAFIGVFDHINSLFPSKVIGLNLSPFGKSTLKPPDFYSHTLPRALSILLI